MSSVCALSDYRADPVSEQYDSSEALQNDLHPVDSGRSEFQHREVSWFDHEKQPQPADCRFLLFFLQGFGPLRILC